MSSNELKATKILNSPRHAASTPNLPNDTSSLKPFLLADVSSPAFLPNQCRRKILSYRTASPVRFQQEASKKLQSPLAVRQGLTKTHTGNSPTQARTLTAVPKAHSGSGHSSLLISPDSCSSQARDPTPGIFETTLAEAPTGSKKFYPPLPIGNLVEPWRNLPTV
ncbi:unnamed protein product [Prunus armeniaca]